MTTETTNKRKAFTDEEIESAAKVANVKADDIIEVVPKEKNSPAWLHEFLGTELRAAYVTLSGPIDWLMWTRGDKPLALPQSEAELPRFCGKLLKYHMRHQYGSFELQLIVQALAQVKESAFVRIPIINKFFKDFLAQCDPAHPDEAKVVSILKRCVFNGEQLLVNGDCKYFGLRDQVRREAAEKLAADKRETDLRAAEDIKAWVSWTNRQADPRSRPESK